MRIAMMMLTAALVASLAGNSPAQNNKQKEAQKAPAQITGPFEELRSEDWVLRAPDKGSVGVSEGALMLRNRGYIFLKREVTKSVTMAFDWTWKDLTQDDERSLYADHLHVLIRSSGEISKKRSYESMDGLRVRIRANDGAVRLEYAKGDNEHDLVKEGKLKRPENGPALAADVAHNILITDTGKTVSVTVGGVEVLKDVPYALQTPGKLVGWANREAVAFPHLTLISNVTVEFKDR